MFRNLSEFQGKVCIIVNVSSKWGKTHVNYTQLQALYEEFGSEQFTILAFPCNQFGKQEPGSDEEIEKFAKEKYNAGFPLFSKVKVNGSDAEPLWKVIDTPLLNGFFISQF